MLSTIIKLFNSFMKTFILKTALINLSFLLTFIDFLWPGQSKG